MLVVPNFAFSFRLFSLNRLFWAFSSGGGIWLITKPCPDAFNAQNQTAYSKSKRNVNKKVFLFKRRLLPNVDSFRRSRKTVHLRDTGVDSGLSTDVIACGRSRRCSAEERCPQRHRNAGNAAVVVGSFGDWEPLPFGVCRSVSLYRSLDLESLPLLLSLPSLVLDPS